jgi:uncharacterized integral membrane protein
MRIQGLPHMKRFFKYLFLVPVALIVLALAVANRHLVTIFLDPFAGPTLEGTQIVAPLYIIMLLAAMAGIVLGSVTTWLEQGTYRRAARRARSEANALRGDLARLSSGRTAEKRKIS